MRDIKLLLVFATISVGTCADGPSGPSGPSGPIPAVLVDREFGEPPVAGTLRIVPSTATAGWRYRVEAIPPETQDREGLLEGAVAVSYRFDAPGVHILRVELTGPDGPLVVEKPIVVVDPESDFEVLAQRPVEEIWPDAALNGVLYPEGIVMDPQGRWLYAANYPSGELVRIDPSTLEVVDRLQLARQLEGLSVTPSGDQLFAVHKGIGLSVVDLSSFTATSMPPSVAEGHFIQALNEDHALVSGHASFARVDMERGVVEDKVTHLWAHPHFDVFPDGQRVVAGVSPWQELPFLEVLALPSLSSLRSIPIEELTSIRIVAVDPAGDRVYALGSRGGETRFVLVDADTGEVLTSIGLGSMVCVCVANPVVTYASGRYIAFEHGGSVVVIDTELDMPRYLFDPGNPLAGGPSGVAAQADSDILFVLGGKFPILRLYKLRLRNP
jgi:DNA-binding beta-propeller fold protein YncE